MAINGETRPVTGHGSQGVQVESLIPVLEALNVSACRLETVEFTLDGDTGYEIGRATLEFATPGAGAAAGKYVVIWKREDGAWKWHVDIWNMSA